MNQPMYSTRMAGMPQMGGAPQSGPPVGGGKLGGNGVPAPVNAGGKLAGGSPPPVNGGGKLGFNSPQMGPGQLGGSGALVTPQQNILPAGTGSFKGGNPSVQSGANPGMKGGARSPMPSPNSGKGGIPAMQQPYGQPLRG